MKKEEIEMRKAPHFFMYIYQGNSRDFNKTPGNSRELKGTQGNLRKLKGTHLNPKNFGELKGNTRR